MKKKLTLMFSLMLGLSMVGPSLAATFCVATVAELKSALSTASTNGQDDQIRIKSGDYLINSSNDLRYYINEDRDLSISGGWSDFNQFNCLVQSISPLSTTLDGDDQFMLLRLVDHSGSPDISAHFSISNLTFANGSVDSSYFAPALTIYWPDIQHSGTILIDRVLFYGNDGANTSAIKIHHGDRVTIRNSVFAYNRSGSGQGAVNINMHDTNTGVYFVNNTVMSNYHSNTSPGPLTSAGLIVTNVNNAFITNNLLWGNDGPDLSLMLEGPHYYLYNNNIGATAGATADLESGNLSAPPMLAPQILNFTPQPGSPLINKGRTMPEIIPFPTPFHLGWNHGSSDFDGFSRVIGGRIDIGAVEAPPEVPIFEHGFEAN